MYLNVYNWILFKVESNFENLIIKSISVSYILKILLNFILENFKKIKINTTNEYFFILLLFSLITATVIALILKSDKVNNFLLKFNIGRTTNKNIWDDIIKNDTWVRVFMTDNTSYIGYFRYGEENAREPIIVLTRYKRLDQNENILEDRTNSDKDLIVLNTKDFEKIEIIYD